MDLEKLKPWNWFKHEEGNNGRQVPVRKTDVANAGRNPASLMQLHHDMDRWFDDAFKSFSIPSLGARLGGLSETGSAMQQMFRPQIDVSGDNNGYQICLEVPGMTEDDLTLEIKDDLLLIRGQKEERTEDKDKHYYRVERSYGSFQRTLSLPDDANADEISASLDKGVLRLEIPRRSEARSDVKRISIKH